MRIEGIIEALLFAAPKAMRAENLIRVIVDTVAAKGIGEGFSIPSVDDVRAAIKNLQEAYDREGRAFQIYEVNHGYRIGTRADYVDWVERLYLEKPSKLSPAALETLAVIAYRQPISRAEIEAIRGVSVDGVIQSLTERRLIKSAGRSSLPGRPQLYQTTGEFLEQFGLMSLDELPNAHELRRHLPTDHGVDLFSGDRDVTAEGGNDEVESRGSCSSGTGVNGSDVYKGGE